MLRPRYTPCVRADDRSKQGYDQTNRDVSKTALKAAIKASEQSITGDPGAHIWNAVQDGTLRKLTADGEKGETVLCGYVHTEVSE